MLSDEKYVLFTTYRRNGTPVKTPVWVVELDRQNLGFYTSSQSGKAKRLAHTDRVVLQPCDARGRIKAGSVPVNGTARLVEGPELEDIRSRVVAKYGFGTKIAKAYGITSGLLKGKRTPYADRGVVITPAV
jgi:uncharacterized protein